MSTHSRLPHHRAVAHTHRLTNTFPYGYTQTHTFVIYDFIWVYHTNADIGKNTDSHTLLQTNSRSSALQSQLYLFTVLLCSASVSALKYKTARITLTILRLSSS